MFEGTPAYASPEVSSRLIPFVFVCTHTEIISRGGDACHACAVNSMRLVVRVYQCCADPDAPSASPQLLAREAPQFKSDVWASGVVLYQVY